MDAQDRSHLLYLLDGEAPRSDTDSRLNSDQLTRYGLRFLQQPQRARACGYGTKDRRRVDPPPVLELYKISEDGIEEVCTQEEPYLVCHASLTDANGVEDCSLIRNHYAEPQADELAQTHHSLIGLYVTTARLLKDVQGTTRLMFVFSDMSIRPAGTFRLRFRLVDLKPCLSGSDLDSKKLSPQHLPSSVGPSAFRDVVSGLEKSTHGLGNRISASVSSSSTSKSRAGSSRSKSEWEPSSSFNSQARSSGSDSQSSLSVTGARFGSGSEKSTRSSGAHLKKVSVTSSTVVALSEPIISYKAKAFPGMLETTELSRALVAAGYSDIHLRRSNMVSRTISRHESRPGSPTPQTTTGSTARQESATTSGVAPATTAIAAATITDPMEPIQDTMVERLADEDDAVDPADGFEGV